MDRRPDLGATTKRACLPFCHILTWYGRGLFMSRPTCLYPDKLIERCSTKPSAWMVKGGGTSVLAVPQRDYRAALRGQRGPSSALEPAEGRRG